MNGAGESDGMMEKAKSNSIASKASDDENEEPEESYDSDEDGGRKKSIFRRSLTMRDIMKTKGQIRKEKFLQKYFIEVEEEGFIIEDRIKYDQNILDE